MNATEDRPVSVGDWIITFILLAIPLVNIVMLFVWAFSDSTAPSKKNYALASLIIAAVVIAFCIIVGAVGGLTGAMLGHHHG